MTAYSSSDGRPRSLSATWSPSTVARLRTGSVAAGNVGEEEYGQIL